MSMDQDDFDRARRLIQNSREVLADMPPEIAAMSDGALRNYAQEQREARDEADWRADCAETELQLRTLRACLMS